MASGRRDKFVEIPASWEKEETITYAELHERMRSQGYTWDGESLDDPDDAFVKESHLTVTIAQVVEYLRLGRPPGDDSRG